MDANNKPMPAGQAPVPVQQDHDNFFTKEGVDSTWTRRWEVVQPPVATHAHDTLIFNLPKLGPCNYYHLQDARIRMHLRLLDSDGNPPPVEAVVGPCEDFGSAIFSDVKLFLNESQSNGSSSSLYPYHSYFHSLLSYSREKKEGAAALQGYMDQNEGDYKRNSNVTSSFAKRRELFGTLNDEKKFQYYDAESQPTVITAPVLTEFTSTSLPILPGVALRLEMKRSPWSFYMMIEPNMAEANRTPAIADFTAKKYRLNIVKANVIVPVNIMNASLDLKVEQMLSKKPLEYRTVRLEMVKKPIAKGRNSYSDTQLKQEAVCPDRLYLAIIPDYNLAGPNGENPFSFCSTIREQYAVYRSDTRAQLEEVRLTINNESIESYDTSIMDDTLYRKYLELNETMGHGSNGTNGSLSFSVKNYEEIFFVMGYDLTAAKNAALLGPDIRGMNKQGAMKLDLRWDLKLPTNCWLIMLSEYHSAVKIDKNRSVMCQYLA